MIVLSSTPPFTRTLIRHHFKRNFRGASNLSTPSSSTLNTSLLRNCVTTKQPGLRCSFSSLSSSSDPVSLHPDNPRVQKMKRSESVVVPATSEPFKRAPSFGSNLNLSSLSDAMNININVAKDILLRQHPEPHPAKRSRKRSHPMPPTTTPVLAQTPARNSATKPPVAKSPSKDLRGLDLGSLMVISPVINLSPAHNTKSATKLCANMRRNLSVLGCELSFPQHTPPAPQYSITSPPSGRMSTSGNEVCSMNFLPTSPIHKSLRRVKATTFGMRPLTRKISFGTNFPPPPHPAIYQIYQTPVYLGPTEIGVYLVNIRG